MQVWLLKRVPAKSQHMNYSPNLSTSHCRIQTHSPRPSLQLFLLRVREFDHTSEGGESQKMSSRACAGFPNRPGHHPCHSMLPPSCGTASKHLPSTNGQVLNIANTSMSRPRAQIDLFFLSNSSQRDTKCSLLYNLFLMHSSHFGQKEQLEPECFCISSPLLKSTCCKPLICGEGRKVAEKGEHPFSPRPLFTLQ